MSVLPARYGYGTLRWRYARCRHAGEQYRRSARPLISSPHPAHTADRRSATPRPLLALTVQAREHVTDLSRGCRPRTTIRPHPAHGVGGVGSPAP
jgi:hypothetical protein